MATAEPTAKSGWEVKTLGEVCDFTRGLTYKKKDEVEHSGNAVLRANNVSLETKILNFDEIKYIKNDIIVPTSKKVRKGSLLICTASGSKNHLGKVALIDEDYDYAFGGFMGLLTPHSSLNSKYFFFSLVTKSYESFISELSDGANINNLKFSQLQEFPIPVPPLDEQERIVGILDEAFDRIVAATAQAKKNLHNARELFQSVLQSTFSQKGDDWKETTVGEFIEENGGEIKTGPFGTKLKASEYTETGVPVISVGEIRIGKLVLHDRTPRVDKGVTDRMPEYLLEEGDILFGRKGAVERSALVREDQEGWFLGSDGIRLRLPSNCNHQFIAYGFLCPNHKSWMVSQSVGTTMPSLNQKIIARIPITICALSTQQSIVEKLDALSEETKRLEAIYERKKAALSELKQSLLQKAFAGEL